MRAQPGERLRASWLRSVEYGIPLDGIEPGFFGTERPDSLFYECGSQVLLDLQQTLVTEPVSLMLTDADGVVLSRTSGDHTLLAALDDVHLAPGFTYAEREVGTNGLGLALADRVPTLVRADQHYARGLDSFTCAAVPVLDPVSGRLEGSVNLTTWSESSSELLLALARSAASSTTALMLARASGHQARPTPRGHVVRVEAPTLEPGSGTLHDLSDAWTSVVRKAEQAMIAGRVVVAIGEPGSGRATALAQAARAAHPRDRILSAAPPGPDDVVTWLGLWTPEVGKEHTAVIVRDVDQLPVWVGDQLRDLLTHRMSTRAVPFAMAAERFEDLPAGLVDVVDTVVTVPPLRDRTADIAPLAQHLARRARGRDIEFSRGASGVLANHGWPGNVGELARVVTHAAHRSDVIDLVHLPPHLLATSGRRLSRIESFERGEIIRVLTTGNPTMNQAANELGMSRATLYRKIKEYGITLNR